MLAVVAILFALSTVLSWGYYGEQAWTWLFTDRKASRVAYRLFLCSVLSVAATLNLGQVVNIVDSLNFCMAIPNLIAVYLLLPELRADLASYWRRVVLKADPEKEECCRVRVTCGRCSPCIRCGGWRWRSTRTTARTGCWKTCSW